MIFSLPLSGVVQSYYFDGLHLKGQRDIIGGRGDKGRGR